MALNSSFVLVLAGAGSFAYQAVQYRSEAARELTTLADIGAASTSAALRFSDELPANEVLAFLRGDREIVAAVVYNTRNRLFARYRNADEPAAALPLQPGSNGVHFEGDDPEIFRPIMFQGERIGTIYLRSNMEEAHVGWRYSLWIAGIVLLASLGLDLLFSSRIQGIISGPITALADVARVISVDRNYSVRAKAAAWQSGTKMESPSA